MLERFTEDTQRQEINSLLRVAEVAKMLYVHPNTIRIWTNTGKLPCFRVGPRGDRRFHKEEVLAFVKPLVQRFGLL